MRTKVLAESTGGSVTDGEVLDVVLDSLTARTLRWNDKQTGAPKQAEVWEWEFRTKGTGMWVRGTTPAGLRGRNRTRLWCEALVGELPDGFEFDTDSLIGLSCRAKVKNGKPYTSKKTGKQIVPVDVEEIYPES